jgi:hypothetical protein
VPRFVPPPCVSPSDGMCPPQFLSCVSDAIPTANESRSTHRRTSPQLRAVSSLNVIKFTHGGGIRFGRRGWEARATEPAAASRASDAIVKGGRSSWSVVAACSALTATTAPRTVEQRSAQRAVHLAYCADSARRPAGLRRVDAPIDLWPSGRRDRMTGHCFLAPCSTAMADR